MNAIYKDFRNDQIDTIRVNMLYKVGKLPILELKSKEDQTFYALASLATLGFLKSMMDDTSLIDTMPNHFA